MNGWAATRRPGTSPGPRRTAPSTTASPPRPRARLRRPAADERHRRAELRSADPTANPYLAFALLIHAALDGIRRGLLPPPSTDVNLFSAPEEVLSGCRRLPASLQEAADAAERSAFIRAHLPEAVIRAYCGPHL